VSNRLIVESKNDQYFFQAIIKYLNFEIEVDYINISEEDYRCLDGSDHQKIKNLLNDLKAEIQKNDIQKVGIILDIDNNSVTDKILLINECIKNVFLTDVQLSGIKDFISIPIDDENSIDFACYFTNIDGKGELETVLKTIKSQKSIHADCLESWRNCLQEHDEIISDKDLNKFWISNYLRFDTCSKEDRKKAGKKCGLQYVMENKTHIWNFEHSSLQELKDFLRLFIDRNLTTTF
jgi:hypothetical protein